ncbi:MAG: hypothetical protein NXY57DRAFT_1012764 [Lentinula lateritia]|nr:MAG: hypothetical protein NXY57DRAFT_1012764 [Lentinula lateritia]
MTTSPSTNLKSKTNEYSFRWLDVSLGATIAAAVAVPGALYLRRNKRIRLSTRPVAPRRHGPAKAPLKSLTTIQPTNTLSDDAQTTLRTKVVSISPLRTISNSPSDQVEPKNDFNPALYTAGAFGIATLLVSVGAVAGVWAIKTTMDVQDTQEFARKMRRIVLTRMPMLSARIHRVLDDGGDDNLINSTDWNWEDAERRLRDAYEKDGIVAWAEATLKELRAEEHSERLKRKELADAHA